MKWKANLYAMVETEMSSDVAMGDFVDDCDKMIYEGWFAHGAPFECKQGDISFICQAFLRRASHASGHKD